MNETENKALTEEQIKKEERYNQMIGALTALFPECKIERFNSSVYVTSTSASFIGSEISKLNAVSTLFGNAGFYITASVANGLQAVLF